MEIRRNSYRKRGGPSLPNSHIPSARALDDAPFQFRFVNGGDRNVSKPSRGDSLIYEVTGVNLGARRASLSETERRLRSSSTPSGILSFDAENR